MLECHEETGNEYYDIEKKRNESAGPKSDI